MLLGCVRWNEKTIADLNLNESKIIKMYYPASWLFVEFFLIKCEGFLVFICH